MEVFYIQSASSIIDFPSGVWSARKKKVQDSMNFFINPVSRIKISSLSVPMVNGSGFIQQQHIHITCCFDRFS